MVGRSIDQLLRSPGPCSLTGPFTISVEIVEFYTVQERGVEDFEAPKL